MLGTTGHTHTAAQPLALHPLPTPGRSFSRWYENLGEPITTHACKEGTVNYKTPTHCNLKAVWVPKLSAASPPKMKTKGHVWRSWGERKSDLK